MIGCLRKNNNNQKQQPKTTDAVLEPNRCGGATRSYKEPQGATRSHREPQGATRSRKQPQGVTRSHKEPDRHQHNNWDELLLRDTINIVCGVLEAGHMSAQCASLVRSPAVLNVARAIIVNAREFQRHQAEIPEQMAQREMLLDVMSAFCTR